MREAEFLNLKSGLSVPRLMPGPMEGAMSRAFCATINSLELVGVWITPFLRLTTAVPKNNKLLSFIEPFKRPGVPLIVQLMGHDPELLGKTAVKLLELGVEGINLNFGCPSMIVVKNNSGGGLLRDLPRMRDILSAVADAANGRSLSVKIRAGFDDVSELPDIMRGLTACAEHLDFIALHFRTVAEQYRKVSGGIERLVHALEFAGDIPLVGSGDVYATDDIQRMLDIGCAGVMAARGLTKDPYLLRRAAAESAAEEFALTVGQGRKIFFNRMLEIARREPGTYWKRDKFLETANMMWGRDSEQFNFLLSLSDNELLNTAYPTKTRLSSK